MSASDGSQISGVTPSVIVAIRMAVEAGRRAEFVGTLRSMLGPTGVAQGCRSCDLWQDTEDEGAFLLTEEWETWDDLRRHVGRQRDFRTLLEALELLREAPDVRVYTVSRTDGLEAIKSSAEEVRLRTLDDP